MTTSGGIDRTMLTLGFEGHQPDIEALKLLYDNPNELIEVSDTAGNKGESKDVPQNVAQNEVDVAQNVPQTSNNVPQNSMSVPQNEENVPQNSMSVPQNEENVPHNQSLDIKKEIVKLINEDLQITREQIAKKLNISSKTVGRYLSRLGISWEGHPKTGHWTQNQ